MGTQPKHPAAPTMKINTISVRLLYCADMGSADTDCTVTGQPRPGTSCTMRPRTVCSDVLSRFPLLGTTVNRLVLMPSSLCTAFSGPRHKRGQQICMCPVCSSLAVKPNHCLPTWIGFVQSTVSAIASWTPFYGSRAHLPRGAAAAALSWGGSRSVLARFTR